MSKSRKKGTNTKSKPSNKSTKTNISVEARKINYILYVVGILIGVYLISQNNSLLQYIGTMLLTKITLLTISITVLNFLVVIIITAGGITILIKKYK